MVLANNYAKLSEKMVDLESWSHRNNIKIVGLLEAIEGHRSTALFAELLVEVLGDQTLQSPPELDRAHKAFTTKPRPSAQPRPVIIRIHRYQTKDLIIRDGSQKS